MPTQQPSKNLKKLLIALGVVIIIAVTVSIIRGGSSSKTTQQSSRPGLVTSQIATTSSGNSTTQTTSSALANDPMIRRSQELAILLKSVSHIKLDTDIFKNPALSGLTDISSPLPADPAPGRPNPFLPIGNDAGMSIEDTFLPTIDPITQFLGGTPS